MKRRIILIFTVIIAVVSSVFAYIKTDIAINAYCCTIINNTVHERVNDSIYTFSANNKALFSDICKYSYTSNGEVSYVSINSYAINMLRQGLEKEILNELSRLKEEVFFMPVGNISGIKLLSGTGPSIKIKIVPLSAVSCDTINDFKCVGINQTLHSVCLTFSVYFSAAPPFASDRYETKISVALCENIIMGKVPNVHFN